MEFEHYMQTGERVYFFLRDGRRFEGWIEDVEADRIRVSWAPSPFYSQAADGEEMNPPDEWIPIEKIDVAEKQT